MVALGGKGGDIDLSAYARLDEPLKTILRVTELEKELVALNLNKASRMAVEEHRAHTDE